MLLSNALWIADIDMILDSLDEIDSLAGKSVLVTGANGLICSSIVDVLIRYNEQHNAPITILAASRSDERIRKRFGSFMEKDYFHFIQYDANEAVFNIDYPVDFIIHGASNAYPGLFTKEPVETMLSNFAGLNALLSFAKKNKVRRVLYISSSEIYGQKERIEPYKENEYGFVDLLNPRNAYSVGKRAAETLCVSYSHEYDIETVIIRPGHIYGPTAGKSDNRVSSSWAYAVADGQDIVMKSDGAQIRSYVYCLDCASAILKVLICGENKRAYNISNPESVISIKEMAEILCTVSGTTLTMELPTDKEKMSFNPMSNSSLDSTRLLELGWQGRFDAKTGFAHTVKILKESVVQ